MRIAVLMTCHNRKEMTLRCLRSLAGAIKEVESNSGKFRSLAVELWLNDDGSTDGTAEAIQEWFDSITHHSSLITHHLVKGSGHDYWARGMARAWQAALEFEEERQSTPTPTFYTSFLWLNDDVVLKPEAIEILLEDAAKVNGVIVGTCSQAADEREVSYSATDERDRNVFPTGEPQQARGWFNGNCVLVPREVYEKVGMIDGAYSHARADYDYAERLKRAGVGFYGSSQFVGVCEKGEKVGVGSRCSCRQGIWQRLRLLVRPSYCNLQDMWRYRVRYYGVGRAVVSCAHLIWMQVRG